MLFFVLRPLASHRAQETCLSSCRRDLGADGSNTAAGDGTDSWPWGLSSSAHCPHCVTLGHEAVRGLPLMVSLKTFLKNSEKARMAEGRRESSEERSEGRGSGLVHVARASEIPLGAMGSHYLISSRRGLI